MRFKLVKLEESWFLVINLFLGVRSLSLLDFFHSSSSVVMCVCLISF